MAIYASSNVCLMYGIIKIRFPFVVVRIKKGPLFTRVPFFLNENKRLISETIVPGDVFIESENRAFLLTTIIHFFS